MGWSSGKLEDIQIEATGEGLGVSRGYREDIAAFRKRVGAAFDKRFAVPRRSLAECRLCRGPMIVSEEELPPYSCARCVNWSRRIGLPPGVEVAYEEVEPLPLVEGRPVGEVKGEG